MKSIVDDKKGLKDCWRNSFMKKCILFAFLCFYSVSAWADRCVLNTQSIAQSALEQLKTATKVVYYCPTCLKDNHVRYIKVSDLKIIQEDKRPIIQIEGRKEEYT